MKLKRLGRIILAVALAISLFTGCASKSEKTASSASMVKVEYAENKDANEIALTTSDRGDSENYGSENETAESVQDVTADSLAGSGSALNDISNAILAERKIIRSAYLTIEVDNFDKALENINSIILGIGFIQETNINAERYVVGGEVKLVKNGTIVLRVDKDKFDNVINSLKGIGTVYNQTISGQDVTDKYIDVESRLRLLKLEQSRLEAYLMKLEDLDKIIRTESRLTEIRQEIERLTGNLNKMNSLVELSTITISMNEKNPYAGPEPATYGEKLLGKLKESLLGVVEFLGNLLIFIVAAIPVLIVLGLFVLLGIFIFRRISGIRISSAGVSKNRDDGKDRTKDADSQ